MYKRVNQVTKKEIIMKEFKEQMTEVEVVEQRVFRTFVKWVNTETGRDKTEVYERFVVNSFVYYKDIYWSDSYIDKHGSTDFFNMLEEAYTLGKENKRIT